MNQDSKVLTKYQKRKQKFEARKNDVLEACNTGVDCFREWTDEQIQEHFFAIQSLVGEIR